MLIAASMPARAQTIFERLVSPGDLIAGHAKLESDCGNCHETFDKAGQSSLCLDCHKDVRDDIAAKAGFHGRHPAVSGQECKHCHTDHEGRDADIVLLNPVGFDHDFTDFALRGGHVGVECASCHAAETRHREAPSTCFACHREDDRHAGRLGEKCGDCHVVEGWAKARSSFDHAKTRFPLTGAHKKAACLTCHLGEVYEGLPRDCVSCHQSEDVHNGRLGPKCETCHATTAWREVSFDHDRDTKFKLTGAHRAAACETCHLSDPAAAKLGKACVDCHRADDVHNQRNGAKCGDCHGTKNWKANRFDHSKTRFPLNGAHATIACEACHLVPADQQKPPTDCAGCHAEDDPHNGSLGRACATCHKETAWRQEVFFDHGLTAFPLIGLHAAVTCEECHATQDYTLASGRCVDCHRSDDVHKGSLGEDCAACHNPNGWGRWLFDHATTGFPLLGGHEDVACEECHRDGLDVSISSRCVDCHRRDDAHRGGFGRSCERCHVIESWKARR